MSTNLANTYLAVHEMQGAVAGEGESRSDFEVLGQKSKVAPSPDFPAQPAKREHQEASRIAIKTNRRILFIDAADVSAVEAEGNYVFLHHKSSTHLLRDSISSVEEKLNDRGFVRIHRSVLVNATKVEEIRRLQTGEHLLRLKDGKEYTVTRTYRQNLRNVSPTCIGGEI